jgi:ubiquinone/menaquinone biosynthesis C-methylase UbiE
MKSILSILILALLFLFLIGCSGPVACGGLKRLMYEGPGRDRWQKPDEVVAALGLAPGDRVADLGSGGGYFTFPIAQAVGPTGRVYAVDVDESLLAYVADQAKKRELSQIVTVHAPEDGLGLPDASVDLVFLSNVFHHLPDPVRYFEGARSVLRANGRIAVVETSEGGFPKGHSTAPEEIRATFEAAGYVLAERHDFLERQSFQIFVPSAPATPSAAHVESR